MLTDYNRFCAIIFRPAPGILKKIPGPILVLLLLLVLFLPMLNQFPPPVHAGGEFAGGTGTAEDPYLVETAEHLNNIRNYLDAHYLQTADICLAVFCDSLGPEGWEPIGDGDNPLTGSLNGNGFNISNLSIDRTDGAFVALFGKTGAGSRIRNVTLLNVNISGRFYVGSLVGHNYSDITNSHAEGQVIGSSDFAGGLVGLEYGTTRNCSANVAVDGIRYVGGLVGSNNRGSISYGTATGNITGAGSDVGGLAGRNTGEITDSHATGAVTGNGERVGGLAGSNFGTIKVSYAEGPVQGIRYVGGLAGYHSAGAIIDAYATGAVEGDIEVGGLVGHNRRDIASSYAVGEVTGTSDLGGLVGRNIDTTGTITSSYYDRETTGQNDSGKGIPKTTLQMQSVTPSSQIYTNWSLNIWIFTPADQYPRLERGEFDGGDGTPGNPFLVATDQNLYNVRHHPDAHFKQTADICLLYLCEELEPEGWEPIGDDGNPFTGSYSGSGYTITNLTIDRPETRYIGLFGSTGFGSQISKVELKHVKITGYQEVGSLAGSNSGVITEGYASGNITGNNRTVGGLVGINTNGTIQESHSFVDVTCRVGTSSNVGGLVGYNSTNGAVINSHATGDVIGEGNYVGGLVGMNTISATITSCYATGAVTGEMQYVGGLVGNNAGIIEKSFARGSVVGDSVHVGGLVGRCQGTITNSYAAGTAAGFNYVGGLVGRNWEGPITNSYATGVVTATGGSDVGGLVGTNTKEEDIVNSYYDSQTTGQNDTGKGIPKTTAEMQEGYPSAEIYTGWPEDVWTFTPSDVYPWLGIEEFAGGDGIADHPYRVATAKHLNNVRHYLDAHYLQVADIDLDMAPFNLNEGWEPIGSDDKPFSGSYDGDGHTISNLFIDRPNDYYLGLFGKNSTSSQIKDLALVALRVTGRSYVGGLVGHSDGNITEVQISGTVTGDDCVGGLVGRLHGIIKEAQINTTVTGNNEVGGLAGESGGTIENSYAAVNVTADEEVGGLVGYHYGTIKVSYAEGSVEGLSYVGGLTGYHSGDITNAYATADVAGSNRVGGLVGRNWNGPITNSYATGAVTATGGSDFGGLVGSNNNEEDIVKSYYDSQTTGQTDTGKGIPKTTAEMQEGYPSDEIYTGWSTDVWTFTPLDKYPWLKELDPYEPVIYTLDVSKVGEGVVRVEGTEITLPYSADYTEGSTVGLEAIPALGWQFKEWIGDATGTDTIITVTMDANKSITAHFSSEQTFSDVPLDHPYYEEIEKLVALEIATGWPDGTFRPTLPVTRMAMAAFLYRAFDLEDPGVTEPTFTDVPKDHTFFTEIEALAASGIAEGWPDSTFRPTLAVTRQAMAAFLFRALELEEQVVDEPTFTDVPESHPFFVEIEALAASGITTGWPDGTFRPSQDVTRQAMAAFLVRALELDDQ